MYVHECTHANGTGGSKAHESAHVASNASATAFELCFLQWCCSKRLAIGGPHRVCQFFAVHVVGLGVGEGLVELGCCEHRSKAPSVASFVFFLGLAVPGLVKSCAGNLALVFLKTVMSVARFLARTSLCRSSQSTNAWACLPARTSFFCGAFWWRGTPGPGFRLGTTRRRKRLDPLGT